MNFSLKTRPVSSLSPSIITPWTEINQENRLEFTMKSPRHSTTLFSKLFCMFWNHFQVLQISELPYESRVWLWFVTINLLPLTMVGFQNGKTQETQKFRFPSNSVFSKSIKLSSNSKKFVVILWNNNEYLYIKCI